MTDFMIFPFGISVNSNNGLFPKQFQNVKRKEVKTFCLILIIRNFRLLFHSLHINFNYANRATYRVICFSHVQSKVERLFQSKINISLPHISLENPMYHLYN